MKNIEEEVFDFFKIHDGLHIEVINKNSIINPKEILTDEAEIILEEFINKFGISKGYLEIDKYFNPLPVLNLRYFWNLITFNLPKLEPKPPITVAHMIEVAKRREWFDPE